MGQGRNSINLQPTKWIHWRESADTVVDDGRTGRMCSGCSAELSRATIFAVSRIQASNFIDCTSIKSANTYISFTFPWNSGLHYLKSDQYYFNFTKINSLSLVPFKHILFLLYKEATMDEFKDFFSGLKTPSIKYVHIPMLARNQIF